MADRARKLDENNPAAAAILDASETMVLGHLGFSLEALSDDDDWNSRVEDWWQETWVTPQVSGRNGVDHRRLFTGPQFEQLAYRAARRDGDCAIVLLASGDVQLVYANRIQRSWQKSTKGEQTITHDGVEMTQAGRPVRYWIDDTRPVPARNVIHYMNTRDGDLTRGVSAFAQALDSDMFDFSASIMEAVAMAVYMAACMGLAIKKTNAYTGWNGLQQGPNTAGDNERQIDYRPGMTTFLEPDEDITQIQAAQPQAQVLELLRALHMYVGAPLGVPVSRAFFDMAGMNLAVSRAVNTMAIERSRRYQRDHAAIMSRIYRWRVSRAIANGELPMVDRPFRHQWIPYTSPSIDPTGDVDHAATSVDLGFTTYAEQLRRLNKNPQKHIKALREQMQQTWYQQLAMSSRTRDRTIQGPVPNG